MILTIIIPVFNEKNTIKKILKKIESVKGIKKQIILVDDGSNDGTKEIIKENFFLKLIKLFIIKKI